MAATGRRNMLFIFLKTPGEMDQTQVENGANSWNIENQEHNEEIVSNCLKVNISVFTEDGIITC